MRPFRRTRDGYVAHLAAGERAALAHGLRDVATLLGDAVPRAATPRGGPANAAGIADPASFADLAGIVGLDPAWSDAAAPAAPTDSGVARLLPAASSDPDVAAEFRRFTQDDLARAKLARLELAAGLLDSAAGRLVVAPSAAEQVAGALTDLRLVLADRLDLRTDEQASALYEHVNDVEPDPRRRFLGAVFLLAGALQESLMAQMLADLRRSDPDRHG